MSFDKSPLVELSFSRIGWLSFEKGGPSQTVSRKNKQTQKMFYFIKPNFYDIIDFFC